MKVSIMGVAIAAAVLCGGCKTDPTIRNLNPPPDLPHLSNLESHLTYVDPDAGESDYIPDR